MLKVFCFIAKFLWLCIWKKTDNAAKKVLIKEIKKNKMLLQFKGNFFSNSF